MQECLLGSFWRWIQAACGLIWSWRTIHRHKCGISLLQRQQLASLSLCLHIGIWFQWGPCWQRLWVCHFAGVLHQGLPVRHRLGLSRGVMGQSTWGWCCWWWLPWSSSCRGAVKVERPGMKRLRYVTRPKNSWSSVTLVGAGKACTTSTLPGSRWTPLAS